MKLPRLLFVSGFLIVGGIVLGVSLVKASDTISESSASSAGTSFSGQVVPGHILYPFQVMRDKFTLMTMGEPQRCEFQLELAQQRLQASQVLVENQDYERAIQTIFKGVLYVASSLEKSQNQAHLDSEYQQARTQLLSYQQFLIGHKDSFPDVHWSKIDQTVAYIEALLLHSPQLSSN